MDKKGYKKTEIGVIPAEWDVVNFKNFFSSVGAKKYQVQKSNYLKNGDYPIIDQGQKFIVGYSDEEDKVYKNIDGVVVFGDHTRIIKFIDFDFVVGADGTQLLKSIDGINQKFSYYVLLSKELTNLGYSRHFKLVKEMKFPLPPLKEQEKIADILSTADEKIDIIALQIAKTEELKKGLLQKLLSEGIGHTEFKNSELGKIPKSWEIYQLNTVLEYVKKPLKMKDEKKYELITVKRRFGGVKSRGVFLGKDILVKNQFYLFENNFLISKRQISHGACGLVPKKLDGAIVSNEYNIFTSNSKLLDLVFFNYYVQTPRLHLSFYKHSHGIHIEKMLFNTESWLRQKIVFPPLKEQKQIADILSTVDEKLEVLRAKKEKYKTLKIGLLQKLLSGKIRV